MLITACLALTLQAALPADSTGIEERALAIDGKVMAPCCWSQPVAQHYSPTATEMRQRTRQMLSAGKSEQEVLDYYVSVYGERILASPRPRGFNLLAWILPGFMLVAGFAFLGLLLRHWTRKKPAADPSEPQMPEDMRRRVEQDLRESE